MSRLATVNINANRRCHQRTLIPKLKQFTPQVSTAAKTNKNGKGMGGGYQADAAYWRFS